jgi:hypothetical protein
MKSLESLRRLQANRLEAAETDDPERLYSLYKEKLGLLSDVRQRAINERVRRQAAKLIDSLLD